MLPASLESAEKEEKAAKYGEGFIIRIIIIIIIMIMITSKDDVGSRCIAANFSFLFMQMG